MRAADCSIDGCFPSAQTILRCLASTPACASAANTGSDASIDRCPSGASTHSSKLSMNGLSPSKGDFVRRVPIG